MKPRRSKPDAGLTPAVLDYLATQRDVWAERRNSGGQLVKNRDGSYRSIALGEPGTPDVTGYLRHDRSLLEQTIVNSEPMLGAWPSYALPFAIELKSKTGRLNPKQQAWHAKAERFGVAVCVARSIGDVKAFLGRLRKGERA